MKEVIGKKVSLIILLAIIFQMLIPIIPELNIKVFAAEKISKETEGISRNYEVKEESWDVSENGDGSVIAKWTLNNRTLTISGTGKMKNWNGNEKDDWHYTQYTNVIEKVIIENGVTSIGESTFDGCSSLKSIEIPDSITSIGWSAFSRCSSLESINIPEGVTSIEDSVFFGCDSLESINIPEGVTNIGSSAFYECNSLGSITIPDSIISIGESAFSECSNLESINVSSNNKKYISENGVLFNKEKTEIICYPAGKKDTKEYIIPERVTNIGSYAFAGCSNLESIIIPSSVTNIGERAFGWCSSLKSINIPSTVTNIEGAVFSECTSLESITIPESVIGIGDRAFSGCSSLKSIDIPSSVTNIGIYVFSGCSSLESINMPEGVTDIERGAFSGCSSLESINIPEGVTSIGNNAFYGCSSLKNITIPERVTSIENNAFNGCSLVMNVKADSEGHRYAEESNKAYILNGIASEITTNYKIEEEKIWDISANGDGSVTAKWILNSRTLIISGTGKMKNWDWNEKDDWHDTQYTNAIEKVIIENGVTSMGSYAFSRCSSLTSIEIPDSITSIGERAFYRCSSLESINIPEGVTSIEEDAFSGCSNLESIDIPSSVTHIKNHVFAGCSSLESITIPDSIASIGERAFYGCSSLKSINIPSSVTNIESAAFSECTSLESISVDINNKNYISEDGILFNKEKTEIMCYPAGKKDLKEYIIPKEVTSIRYEAFEGCSSLESIDIPSSVTNIGNNAFLGCSSLKSINIPEGVTSIRDSTFYRCSSLESINIPEGVTRIGYSAFYGCSSLKSINIPEGVTSIEYGVFDGCISLESINIPSSVTSIENEAFDGCSNLESINVDKDNEQYISENGILFNKEKTEIIKYPEGKKDLKEYVITERITSIRENSFYESNNLIIYTNSNSEGHRYAEEYEQAYVIDDEGPTVTFTPNGSNNPKKGYTVKVNVEDNQEVVGVNEESLKYLWTQSEEVPTKESFEESLKNGQDITKNTGDGIWYLWVYSKDNLDNEKITRSEGFYIDNTAPSVNVEYSTKNPTNKNVKVTITANEEIQSIEGWTLSSDKNTLIKEYSENTKETIVVKDIAGNEVSTNIEITNIDKTLPEITIGDINNDGNIDITDLFLLKRHIIAGSREGWKLTGESLTAADINEDGNVDVTDLLILKRTITENI